MPIPAGLRQFFRMVETADIFAAKQMADSDAYDRALKSGAGEDTYAVQGVAGFYHYLLSIMIEADARGVYPIRTLMEVVAERMKNGIQNGDKNIPVADELLKTVLFALRMYSTKGKFVINDADMLFQNSYAAHEGAKQIDNLVEIMGWTDDQVEENSEIGVVLATTPLVTPHMRNVDNIQFWLNSIPSYAASRMMPYFDVKFQFQRDQGDEEEAANTTFGLLKFLEGAQLSFPEDSANKAMFDGNHYSGEQIAAAEQDAPRHNHHYRAGMEVFLSPQTLVNPNPEGHNDRYVDVIDRFRPLASLKSADINIQPLIGFMTYKNGTLTFVVHDRSRLHEIADMIRPQLFKGTTLWLTYGWRHPEELNNPFANFINQTMLVREAFMVVNAEFSFDNVGQVEVKLHIATQGARTAEVTSIVGENNEIDRQLRQLEDIRRRIEHIKQRLNLVPPHGVKDEVRAYELLDAAARGAQPDMEKNELKKALKALKSLLNTSAADDALAAELNNVQTALEKMYSAKSNEDTKEGFNFENLKNTYEQVIADKFANLSSTPDPWKMTEDTVQAAVDAGEIPDGFVDQELLGQYKFADDPKNAIANIQMQNRVVSFGKLFMMFVGNAIANLEEVDEVQVWFYKLNDHCGPASGINIASFPIEVASFLRKYNDYVFRKRSQRVSVKEFMSILIGTQFGDVRGLGYGMRNFYEPYDPKNIDPKVKKGQQKALESAVKERQLKYGVFQKPALQVFIETVHARTDKTSSGIDLLQLLDYVDSPDAQKFGASPSAAAGSYKRVMRIHIYDKAMNPYPAESHMLRDKLGNILEIPGGKTGESFYNKLIDIQRRWGSDNENAENAARNLVLYRGGTETEPGTVRFKTHDIQPNEGDGVNVRQQLTEMISRRMPSIYYGNNGTVIHNASLSTKADSRVSTINMIRPVGNQVTMQPNGAAVGNLPVRVIPATMNMSSLGCPLCAPAQLYYFDFNTGTTVDNLYILTHVNHTFGPGKFETSWQFGYSDGYARYENLPTIMANFAKEVEEFNA